MARLPDGEIAPDDGALPAAARAELPRAPLGVYVHVPFCATRCGYCDFNTYTAAELPGGGARAAFADQAEAELRMARRVLGADGTPPVSTVFFGGGTPTLLPAGDLVRVLGAIDRELGIAPGAEVTIEANPESVDERALAALRGGGFTRISLGMQSAAPHVLTALERVHTPGRAAQAVAEARAAGFEHVSLDLIYGAPGERDEDWRQSLEAALAAGPDHVSAYALIVEPGTRLAALVRRGQVVPADDDAQAARYEIADDLLSGAGLSWYEICNWAAGDDARCRHNVGYWRGANWWGVGPGAHSHVGGVRWWNVLHPTAWAARLDEGRSPAAGREVLEEDTRHLERVMLEVRLAEGLDLGVLHHAARTAAHGLAADGLLEPAALAAGRAVLTRRGRLLADHVSRVLTD
jgi:putative oxygen-independent coproporphyrinogen III oxidase